MKSRFYKESQEEMARLLFENHMDMGMDAGPEMGQTDVVMEIEPIAPVEPVQMGGMDMGDDDDVNCAVNSELKKLEYYTQCLSKLPQGNFEPWMLAKLSKAAEYVSDIYYQVGGADFANTGFQQAPSHDDGMGMY